MDMQPGLRSMPAVSGDADRSAPLSSGTIGIKNIRRQSMLAWKVVLCSDESRTGYLVVDGQYARERKAREKKGRWRG